ncbi:hypothetical protein XaCFBP7622_21090, partial [Xanthomonas arboricola]
MIAKGHLHQRHRRQAADEAVAAPKISWTPVISPAGFVIYSGKQFPAWRGKFRAGIVVRDRGAVVVVSVGDD